MEITKSLKAYLYDKTSSPLYGNFIVSWCLWNWKILYVTLFVSESKIGNKLDYITSNLGDWSINLWFPLASVAFLILVVPLFANGAKWITLIYEEWMRNKSNNVEKQIMLSVDESIQLRLDLDRQQKRFAESMKAKDQELLGHKSGIDALVDEVKTLNEELEGKNKGLKFLKGEFGYEGTFHDVTEQLNSMIKDGVIDLQAKPELFGELDNGKPKQLKVIYVNNGVYNAKVMSQDEREFRVINSDMQKLAKANERRKFKSEIYQ